jgi:malonate decarboxylase beta subunit
MPSRPFSELTVVERAAALIDAGTLALVGADGGDAIALTVARGRLGGDPIILALTDGRSRGGTLGMAEARHFSRALALAERSRSAVAICWDTGGVRVEEGPAALAATSALGVRLARLALQCVPAVAIVSGPRGCFGAPAVVAALGQATAITESALWGLTGPKLLDGAPEAAARAVMAGTARAAHGHATLAIADTAPAIRRALVRLVRRPVHRAGVARVVAGCVDRVAELAAQLAPAPPNAAPVAKPRRDFFAYSFRHQWRVTGPVSRSAHVDTAWGELAGMPVMGIIVGPERPQEGIGVRDAEAVARAVQLAVARRGGPRAPIVTFLFCRGHATTLEEERAGLPCALAECLRALTAARLAGHPLVCVLGGGAYGAAYLTLAAPSHRVLAIRGTAVAPMAPRVLAAFQRLRGVRDALDTPRDLAEMIPEIRIVDSVVRLPRALTDELAIAREAAAIVSPARRLARW